MPLQINPNALEAQNEISVLFVKHQTLRNILLFFSAVSLAKGLGILSTFLLAMLLTPGEYGIFITLQLVNSYSPILCLGTMETLVKNYPYHMGKGDTFEAQRLESTVYGSIVLASGFVLVLGIPAIIGLSHRLDRIVLAALGMVVLVSSIDFFTMFAYNRSMAHQEFGLTSIFETVRATLSLALVVPLAYRFHLLGAVVGYFLSTLVMNLLAMRMVNRKCGGVRFHINRSNLVECIRIGLPISLIFWLFTIQQTIDRAVSMVLLGSVMTGYYGLGTRVVSTLAVIPVSAGRVLYPRISEELGRGSDKAMLEGLVMKPTLALATFIAPLIGLGVTVLPKLYEVFFPKYLPGVVSAQILLVGFFFTCQFRNGLNYLLAANRQRLVLFFSFISVVVSVLLQVGLVKAGFGISGIALGTACAGLLLTVLIWYTTLSDLGYGLRNIGLGFVKLYSPFVTLLTGPLVFAYALAKVCEVNSQLVVSLLYAVFTCAFALHPHHRREILGLFDRMKRSLRFRAGS